MAAVDALRNELPRTAGASGSLRPGPRGVSRKHITDLQRDRLLAAAISVVADVGYRRLTVGRIIASSKVSRKTFYDVFRDRDDCFHAAFMRVIEQLGNLARAAYAEEPDWREGVRMALGELLIIIDREPHLGRLCVVEALAGDDEILRARACALAELAEVVDRGRSIATDQGLPSWIAESVVNGVFGLVHTRLVTEPEEPLEALLGHCMYLVVQPYLGATEAARELDMAGARTAARLSTCRTADVALDDLNFRLTYRTVQVLGVIASSPASSNREVATRAGVSDQGQISKLLARLARLELVENRGEGQAKGAANAWHLTRRGADLLRSTHPTHHIFG